MGVYIKDMEMPKDKEVILRIDEKGEVYVYGSYPTELHKAVSVPPHGRLIDADAVSLEGGPYEYDEWCKWALEQYQDAPTIIPADPAEEGET